MQENMAGFMLILGNDRNDLLLKNIYFHNLVIPSWYSSSIGGELMPWNFNETFQVL